MTSSMNHRFVKSLGADNVLDDTKHESIKDLEEYDFVLDAVGKNVAVTVNKKT